MAVEAWDREWWRRELRGTVAASAVVVTSSIVVPSPVVVVTTPVIVVPSTVVVVRAVTLVVVGVVVAASASSTATEPSTPVLLAANMRLVVLVQHLRGHGETFEKHGFVRRLSIKLGHLVVYPVPC